MPNILESLVDVMSGSEPFRYWVERIYSGSRVDIVDQIYKRS